MRLVSADIMRHNINDVYCFVVFVGVVLMLFLVLSIVLLRLMALFLESL